VNASDVSAAVGDLPWMTPSEGERLISFMQEHGLRAALELGFCHGVSTCYLAAGVGPEGRVTTIDRNAARSLTPNVEALLARCSLRDRVDVFYEPRSYNWRLMKLLEAHPEPRFDLCFIDGAHSWQDDGFAFLLCDRLLRKGGWVVFDDLDWTLARAPDVFSRSLSGKLTPEERHTPQIRRVYELLVKTHPEYGEFRTDAGWAYARKQRSSAAASIRTETVVRTLPVPVDVLRGLLQRSARGAT
jgi:predicted O-methyltransferase YrrM